MFTLSLFGAPEESITEANHCCLFWDRQTNAWTFTWEDDKEDYVASYMLTDGKLYEDEGGKFIEFRTERGIALLQHDS